MKIEKINDNQIRCTLTKQDLEERNIQLTELCYGTEKAKQLFRDMMVIAHRDYGWTNEPNIPLMIEAIPVRDHCLILNITKVEDPEELDTRFSRFTASDELPDSESAPVVEGADDILDLIRHFVEKKNGAKAPRENSKGTKDTESSSASAEHKADTGRKASAAKTKDRGAKNLSNVRVSRVFRFAALDDAIGGAAALNGFFNGGSSLYRAVGERDYLLVVHQKDHTPEDFNRICNILSEYGRSEAYTKAAEAYLQEHGEIVIAEDAVGKLSSIKAQ